MSTDDMEHKVFKSLNRRSMIMNYLKDRGRQTLEDMKLGFLKANKIMPFMECEDSEILSWLDTIDGISRTRLNGVVAYSIVKDDPTPDPRLNHKRKYVSPHPATDVRTAKRQMTSREVQVTSTPTPLNAGHVDIENVQNKQSRSNAAKSKCNKCGTTQSKERRKELGDPHLFGIPLVGDHQMLNIALYDLHFKQKPYDPRRQSGNCVSALRIREATHKLHDLSSDVKEVIVNVGSTDVAEGKPLIEMIRDIKRFVATCDDLEIKPILTTLAPLANYCIDDAKKRNLLGFNAFIMEQLSKRYFVIDLYNCMLTPEGAVDPRLYQYEARYIKGSRKSFVMWNKLGRQKIRNTLVNNLGYAVVFNN